MYDRDGETASEKKVGVRKESERECVMVWEKGGNEAVRKMKHKVEVKVEADIGNTRCAGCRAR